jgi:hypothetical protein
MAEMDAILPATARVFHDRSPRKTATLGSLGPGHRPFASVQTGPLRPRAIEWSEARPWAAALGTLLLRWGARGSCLYAALTLAAPSPDQNQTPPVVSGVPRNSTVAPGGTRMLDLAYILIGAVFLGACALYALACDRL